MSETITRGQLDKRIERLRTTYGLDIGLDWCNGGVRVVTADQSRDISLRGTKGAAMEVLVAIEEGYRQCLAKPIK